MIAAMRAGSLTTRQQERQLTSVVAAAGFGAGYLPPDHIGAITTVTGQAEKHLRALLGPGGNVTGPQEDLDRRTPNPRRFLSHDPSGGLFSAFP